MNQRRVHHSRSRTRIIVGAGFEKLPVPIMLSRKAAREFINQTACKPDCCRYSSKPSSSFGKVHDTIIKEAKQWQIGSVLIPRATASRQKVKNTVVHTVMTRGHSQNWHAIVGIRAARKAWLTKDECLILLIHT
jgi:hypothetical protein